MSDDLTTTSAIAPDRSRRWFLGAAAAVGAGAVLAACGNDDEETGSGATATTTAATTAATSAPSTSSASAGGDAKIAATAAGLEVLAVGTYKAALDAATAGKLGTVPPAVATFVQTAMGHHQAALDGWNTILKGAGGQAVTQPPASLKATVDQRFAQVKDVGGAAQLALLLEKTAADTYLAAQSSLTGKDAITRAGALQSVDQEHVAILLFVLGEYPVPEVFQKTDDAFKG